MTLSNLGLDYIDMYMIHAPTPLAVDDSGLAPKQVDGNLVFEPKIDFVGLWKVTI